jgi:hypothetical protein
MSPLNVSAGFENRRPVDAGQHFNSIRGAVVAAIADSVSASETALPVCLRQENPHRLVSLWEIMRKFEASMCCGLIANMMQREQVASTSSPRSEVPQHWLNEAEALLLAAKYLSSVAGLIESAQFVDRIDHDFKSLPVTVEEFQYSFLHLRQLMESEMKKQLFLSVPSSLAEFYENEEPMGDAVFKAFPSARVDISEAGSCLACGRNNSGMYHLMLAAEIAMRELGHDRQIPFALKGDIEFKQWGEIIKQLEIAVAAIQQWPNSSVKDEAHKFYNSAVCELRSFNDGWRRHLAHARTHEFDDTEALALWGHVSRFLKLLASKMSEGKYTAVVWQVVP